MILLAYYITLFLLLVIPFLYCRVLKEQTWKKTITELLPFNNNFKEEIIGGIKLFFLLLIGFILIILLITLTESQTGIKINDLEKVNDFINQEMNQFALGFIIILLVVLFIEELFFRAFLIKKIGIFASTIIFTIFHIGYGSIAQIIGVFFLGLILAYWFKKNKSIVQNYIGHVLYDLFAIALYFLI